MNHLVSLALGPVQDFIAAALRTRDLWMGSWMLSEVSKAAALAMQQNGARLIFPAASDESELAPNSRLNVANRILARVEGDEHKAKEVLEQGRKAAIERWQSLVDDALQCWQKLVPNQSLRADIVQIQRDDMLEFFLSWAAEQDDYLQAREVLDRLTAARKNTRDFQPAARAAEDSPGFGLPKSSLDARRETVLPASLSLKYQRRVRMGEGEQLDLAGLVKRLAEQGRSNQFTPVTRVAADAWLEGLDDSDRQTLLESWESLRNTLGEAWITRVEGNAGRYGDFPYDGSLLYPDRLDVALRQLKREKDNDEQIKALHGLRRQLNPLYRKYGQPGRYYALLMADGDHMGRALDQARTAEQHRKISACLADFSAEVDGIVGEHRGHCIYAGGDDALAFVPVDKVLACANELRLGFAKAFDGLNLLTQDHRPTLTAGVVIAHVMEPLGRVRQWAMQAEKAAKQGLHDHETRRRNALGIFVNTRSGAPVRWRGRWDEEGHEDMQRWQVWFAGHELPTKLPYELRGLLMELGLYQDGRIDDVAQKLWLQELSRILKRKQPDGSEIAKEVRKQLEQDAEKLKAEPRQLVNGLLMARWLAASEEF